MIVLDASAAIEWLLQTSAAAAIDRKIFASAQTLHVPQLFYVEVCQILRRNVLSGNLKNARAEQALQDLIDLRVRRYAHRPLLHRVWELRGNLTVYDALYIALAEALGATLLTRDRKLASAPGNRARVQLV